MDGHRHKVTPSGNSQIGLLWRKLRRKKYQYGTRSRQRRRERM